MIHEVLEARRDEVMARWKAVVQGKLAPQAIGNIELIDHLPMFLGEVISALKKDVGLPSSGPAPEQSQTAAEHGEQRLRLGFSLDAVVREYGALRDAMVATVTAAGAPLTLRELEVIDQATISGIAHAVTEYTSQRDAELARSSNEHFAFVAHELRNPLYTATMAVRLLRQRGQLPTEGRDTVALEQSLKQMRELMDHSLDVARVASGIELRRQTTTLRALCDEAELGAAPEAEEKRIRIQVQVEGDDPLQLDVRLLSSALGNLVRNAVKFTAPGSLVEIRGRIAKGTATIEIEDACGGLPPGKIELVFAPFVRLESREKGYGLGLAIAKQAVDAHGGTIRLQNLPGKGCIFVLQLPVE